VWAVWAIGEESDDTEAKSLGDLLRDAWASAKNAPPRNTFVALVVHDPAGLEGQEEIVAPPPDAP